MGHILVVDDDPMVTRLVRINLELEGFEVVEAWDGKTALRLLEENTPDLLVLDIMMPQMDGWQVLTKIREQETFHDLPIVILTAKVQDADILKGWKLGADGYIVKPFNPVSLAETLRSVISTNPAERNEHRRQELAKFGEAIGQ
jgi:DNA-binding response OmpR family regulator